MKILSSLLLLFLLVVSSPGQRISAWPETLQLTDESLFLIARPSSNFKVTYGTLLSNISTRLPLNSNQFAQSTVLTIKDGSLFTNLIAHGLSIPGTNRLVFSNGTAFAMSPTNDAIFFFNTNGASVPSLIFGDYFNGAGFKSGGGTIVDVISMHSNNPSMGVLRMRNIILTNGSAAGLVWTATDANGAGEWQAPAAGGGSATNVGVGQTVYLDAAFGNDATAQRTNAMRPFLTASNAVAAMLSGDTLVVRGGDYPVNPKAAAAADFSAGQNKSGGLAITNRNNIRITGEPGSVWRMSGFYSNSLTYSCPMLNLTRCTNVVIDGLTMMGIRTNAVVIQDYAVLLTACDNVTFRGVTISNWQNQGITDLSQTTINRGIQVLECKFADIGGTNCITLGTDGTAFSCIASNLILTGNRFYRNLRDFEVCCNGDTRGLIFEGNISEACYQTSILLIGTNTSEARIVNNIAIGYATNVVAGGAQWLQFWSGSNVVVQGNQVGGFATGIGFTGEAGQRLVDIGIYDNVIHDSTISAINVHDTTAEAAKAERISVMRNKIKNATAQAVTISANHSRIEYNEMADCNTSQTVGGVIRIGFSNGYYTNTTNMSIVGNKIYTSHFSANTSTGIVIYGLSYSNVVWGNEVRSYAATLHDVGSNTLTMPLNKISPGKLLYADTNSRMAEVTIGSGVAFDGSTGTLTGSGSTQMVAAAIGSLTVTNDLNAGTLNVNTINVTNRFGSNIVGLGYQDLTNIVRRQTIYVDAGAMISNATAGATFFTEETSPPTNRMNDSFLFSGTVTNIVQFRVGMPENWNLSTVKVKLWTTSTNNIATTTNVWSVSAAAVKNNSVITNIDWGTELTITNTVSSAGSWALLTPATPALTVGNTPVAAGQLVWFRIRRLPGHVDDNDGGQQKLLAAWVQYGETMSEVTSW